MTDRERHAPPGPPGASDPHPAHNRPPGGDARIPTHSDPARPGDPPMPLTLAPPTQGRTSTDHLTATPAPNGGRVWLARLFAGERGFPALVPTAIPVPGRGGSSFGTPTPLQPLTPAEHDALARALGCHDLFVLDAADRPARERLIADLIRLTADRGERVLALSPDPASADRIAESVAAGGGSVVRALADDENPLRPA